MRTNPWPLSGLIACGLMIANCASSPPISRVAPPRLILAEAATRSCALANLPEAPVQTDLEAAYLQRGAQIVACDSARRLAVETLMAERELLDRWKQAETQARKMPPTD